ncbi:MAG: ABC transporter ATP-binding protein [Hyphomicrobiales bacterium]|nr:ABC transporter ATP-binding protein [Hyphomicrobiales bacterium]
MALDEPAPTVLLEANDLHKSYGPVHAIRGVDFALAQNSYVTLLGPSGCGKTTILRLIGGFETPDSGRMALAGQLLDGVPAARRPVNTVFQSYALFPHLDVTANVGFGLSLAGLGAEEVATRTADALRMVRMEEMANRRPHQLSGGQQQRVALARAIVNRPKILLLDEPLSALDRKMRKDMQIELKDLQRRLGLTFLHVTHDQEEAFALSDRIIVMNSGLIEQSGTPEAIYRHPESAYVADFIGGSNLLPAKVVAVVDGKATVECAFGSLISPAAPGVGVGKRASICLRPELLVLSGDAPRLAARVTHVVFQGADWLVEATAGEHKLLVRAVGAAPPPEIGSSVSVHCDPDQAWVAAGDPPIATPLMAAGDG